MVARVRGLTARKGCPMAVDVVIERPRNHSAQAIACPVACTVVVLSVGDQVHVLVCERVPANDDSSAVAPLRDYGHESLLWPCSDPGCDSCQDRFGLTLEELRIRSKKGRNARD